MKKDSNKKKSDGAVPEYRQCDPGKAVGGCDGYFDPGGKQRQGPMREGKTQQDHIAKDQRPRYQKWLKTQ